MLEHGDMTNFRQRSWQMKLHTLKYLENEYRIPKKKF